MSDLRVRNPITKMISLSLVHSVVFREVLSSKETPNVHISTQIFKKNYTGVMVFWNCSDYFSGFPQYSCICGHKPYPHFWHLFIFYFWNWAPPFHPHPLAPTVTWRVSQTYTLLGRVAYIYLTAVKVFLTRIFFFCIYFGTMEWFKRGTISALHWQLHMP